MQHYGFDPHLNFAKSTCNVPASKGQALYWVFLQLCILCSPGPKSGLPFSVIRIRVSFTVVTGPEQGGWIFNAKVLRWEPCQRARWRWASKSPPPLCSAPSLSSSSVALVIWTPQGPVKDTSLYTSSQSSRPSCRCNLLKPWPEKGCRDCEGVFGTVWMWANLTFGRSLKPDRARLPGAVTSQGGGDSEHISAQLLLMQGGGTGQETASRRQLMGTRAGRE